MRKRNRAMVILTTVARDKQAERIASALVTNRFAACVNIIPAVFSVYRWKGNICKDRERLLIVKTSPTLFEKTRKKIREIHPYELPEIIALPVEKADIDYLRWIGNSLFPDSATDKKSKKNSSK
ncbi:MAG: divalent-cation tolerance protein CutA [Acidobacteriota bacterium]